MDIRTATALKQVIADYFQVDVEPRVHWLPVQPRFAFANAPDEALDDSMRLGFGAIAGDQIWQDEFGSNKIGPVGLTISRVSTRRWRAPGFCSLMRFFRMN
jgi:hypothetical protein